MTIIILSAIAVYIFCGFLTIALAEVGEGAWFALIFWPVIATMLVADWLANVIRYWNG